VAPRKRARYRVITLPHGSTCTLDYLLRTWTVRDKDKATVDYGKMTRPFWTRYLDDRAMMAEVASAE